MSSRRVVILFIAALLVIAGAIWLSSQRHLDRAVAVGQPVLPDLKKELNSVTEVRIAKADGEHATLRKSGADWLVAERDFFADAARVRKLLIDVAALEVQEEKTSDPERYAAIGVEDVTQSAVATVPEPGPAKDPYDFTKPLTATRVDVVTPAKTWSLLVGKSSGSKAGFVRVAGARQSFLASPRLDIDFEPQRWLDKTIADIPQARIQSVDMQPAKGPAYTVTRAKREDENFTVSNVPKNRKLSYDGVANSLARGLEALAFDDLQKPVTAAAAPGKTIELSHVTYHTFDGVTVEANGRKESSPGLKKDDPQIEKFFIALSAASKEKAGESEAQKLNARVAGREFEISSYKYAEMFKPMESLLEAPSTVRKN